MADHFRIDYFGNPAVQQTSQTLKVVDKGGYQRVSAAAGSSEPPISSV